MLCTRLDCRKVSTVRPWNSSSAALLSMGSSPFFSPIADLLRGESSLTPWPLRSRELRLSEIGIDFIIGSNASCSDTAPCLLAPFPGDRDCCLDLEELLFLFLEAISSSLSESLVLSCAPGPPPAPERQSSHDAAVPINNVCQIQTKSECTKYANINQ